MFDVSISVGCYILIPFCLVFRVQMEFLYREAITATVVECE